MLHILFTILISLGAANMTVVEQPREFKKENIEVAIEDDILLDGGEDVGDW
jgi:hypothetical protein